MTNHVTVKICGEEYTMITEDAAEYSQKIASYVSDKMQDTRKRD